MDVPSFEKQANKRHLLLGSVRCDWKTKLWFISCSECFEEIKDPACLFRRRQEEKENTNEEIFHISTLGCWRATGILWAIGNSSRRVGRPPHPPTFTLAASPGRAFWITSKPRPRSSRPTLMAAICASSRTRSTGKKTPDPPGLPTAPNSSSHKAGKIVAVATSF